VNADAATRATYALLVSLLPATATVIGVIVLAQRPTPVEVAGVVLVILGVAVHGEGAGRRQPLRGRAGGPSNGRGSIARSADGGRRAEA
jgi:inner membrane transporter RhtA